MSTESTGRGAWTEPGVYEVHPGVHRMPLPLPNDGLRAVNVYVIVSGDGLVLIDSGWAIPEARSLLEDGLRELGATPADIRRFLVTHVHRDHYAQALAVRSDFGTTVALGAGELGSLELILTPERLPLAEQLQTLRGMGATALADGIETFLNARAQEEPREQWELPDEWLVESTITTETGRVLDVVPTPGHTQGHVVFHDTADQLLFAGDHVLPTITPSIGFEPVLSPNPLGDFLDSLAVVRSRPDAMLLPAHGPVAPSAHTRVDELIAHHGRRLDETEAAVRQGATTAYDVAGQLKWTRRERLLADLDPFNQMLAISETGAHLTLLLAQRRLQVEEIDGIRHFSA